MSYTAPIRDIGFVLHEVLNVSAHLQGDELDAGTIDQVLDAAATFASEVIAPLNAVGDREGCTMPAPGVVKTPTGFKAAYDQYLEGGWTALACEPDHGGQGMPSVLAFALGEIFGGANMAWSAYPGMSHAAYICLAANGSDEQRSLYCPQIASGQWAGTMCLTEPHCGTDLGMLRTRAVPQADGIYAVTGTKIFISGGEQDLTENIIHLVLARLPDAPPGVKGISLFIVPKFLPTPGPGLGARNGVTCGSVEHKMGIHGNATCTMNFDGAAGWLLGKPNNGLAAMFVMMNHARLGVGITSVGLMEAGYQKALAYAKDRLQGRAPSGGTRDAPADPIVAHPDVRRMLLTQKAYVEGARAFALWASHLMDVQHGSTDATVRKQTAAILALATPVVKSFSSDLAVECTSLAMQVYGGHGYICENLVEQHLRDARIIPLYEGSNGIQAMDLLGRKVVMDGAAGLSTYLDMISEFADAQAGIDGMELFTKPLTDAVALTKRVARELSGLAAHNADEVGSAAAPFLRMVGHVSLAWMWARMAAVGLAHKGSSDVIYASKLATARFYYQRLLPEIHALSIAISAGASCIMEPKVEWL